jgi:alpha-galactosidase
MTVDYLSTHTFGDTVVRYPRDKSTGCVGLEIIPASAIEKVVARRQTLRGIPYIDALPFNETWPTFAIESLVQFKLVGEQYPGAFVQGHSLRQSASVSRFTSADQQIEKRAGETTIITKLSRQDGCAVEHRLSYRVGDSAFEINSSFINGSSASVRLEMFSSFSLAGVTPFARDDAPGRLRVHRFRSGWSAEGRLTSQSIEELHLERSWSGTAAFSERFGQVGTMPVRKWFPFVAVEDTAAGVLWGAQLAWSGSWQMEIFRQHDNLALSGGLADREFGHWLKTVQPGETFTAPPAFIACASGSLDELCDRLTALQQRAANLQPSVEQDLPIVFNEWCTTWGDPSHEKICALADRLKGSPVRYLVIDAGWYKRSDSDWSSGHGDWIPSAKLFPAGIQATAAVIRERGLIPGLWFEMETVGSQSTAFSLADHLLQRDGQPVTCRERRFWNLNDPVAVEYLSQRVIGLLEQGGFGYLKVDYNETAGIGFDDPDSLGEGLRKQIEGQYRFFDLIRQRLPNLVIENCSSGGHRLEPSMLGRTAMSSFSDAHELPEIPIIAANLHRLILPRQSQIWAVLRKTDSRRRLIYSLAATFLGRMCLSGEVNNLGPQQWQVVERAMRLYGLATPVIKDGISRRFGEMGESWRHPQGWQAVVRTGRDAKQALVVWHSFANAPKTVEVPLPEGNWRATCQLVEGDNSLAEIGRTGFHCETGGDFGGGVCLATCSFEPLN